MLLIELRKWRTFQYLPGRGSWCHLEASNDVFDRLRNASGCLASASSSFRGACKRVLRYR